MTLTIPKDPTTTPYPIFFGVVEDRGLPELLEELPDRDSRWKTNANRPVNQTLSVSAALIRNRSKDHEAEEGGAGLD